MRDEVVHLMEKMKLVEGFWRPRIIEQMNEYQLKLARFYGEFVWHEHAETDELFMVLKGNLVIEFRDKQVNLGEGELYVVPKGVEHRPVAAKECQVLLIEPAGTRNTGEVESEMTASNTDWV